MAGGNIKTWMGVEEKYGVGRQEGENGPGKGAFGG